MSKKINAYIENNRIIIVSDDVEKNDYIELNSISSISEYIKQAAQNNDEIKKYFFDQYKQNEEYKKLINSIQNLENENKSLNDINNDQNKKIEELSIKINNNRNNCYH